jgi:deoxycytidine triphosphate deaminase
MPFVGGARIKQCKDELFEEFFCEDCLQPSSYDLRLGEEFYIVGRKAPEKLSDKNPYLSLPPGQFAILTCYEKLHLPKAILGLITLRNQFKMQGVE